MINTNPRTDRNLNSLNTLFSLNADSGDMKKMTRQKSSNIGRKNFPTIWSIKHHNISLSTPPIKISETIIEIWYFL
jgi:hypothetical protein